jgi:thioredoxin 1
MNPDDSNDATVIITDGSFDELVKENHVLVVDCWAPWCGPCRMLTPTIEALARDYKGRAAFGKLNTDDNPAIARRFQIMAVPTLLLFKDGKYVDRLIGVMPKKEIEETINKYL